MRGKGRVGRVERWEEEDVEKDGGRHTSIAGAEVDEVSWRIGIRGGSSGVGRLKWWDGM